MARPTRFVAFVLLGGICGGAARAQERGVVNWAAPLFWSPGQAAQAPLEDQEGARVRSKATPALTTSPVPLIGITPCRIVDTRNASMPAGYGPPQLSAGVPRSFTLTGQCGIAAGAQAVSLNITVVSPAGLGYVLLYPEGGSQPVVSTLNFTAGQTVANAAIVPLGAGGGITVAAALSNTELLIDTNGYYAAAGVGAYNTFLGVGAGNFTMTGDVNTAIGRGALANNTTGDGNTASGEGSLGSNTDGTYNSAMGTEALFANTTGVNNTAGGAFALYTNTIGGYNTASGYNALYSNTEGSDNTATGAGALFSNVMGIFNTASGYGALATNTDGYRNTATGASALYSTTIAFGNTASGDSALYNNTTGLYNVADGASALFANLNSSNNVAIGSYALYAKATGHHNSALGDAALFNLTDGNYNIGIGFNAGFNLTTGSDNLYLANQGDVTESATIRIGSPFAQNRAFIIGVRGVTTGVADAIPVMIDSSGQLGTVSSSARFKEDIADMGEASGGLLKLRPVTFRYKGQNGGPRQFGLVAEEVDEVLPELVVRGSSGEVETVLYHEMPAMLVNELQKQQRRNEEQDEEICALRARLAELESMFRAALK